MDFSLAEGDLRAEGLEQGVGSRGGAAISPHQLRGLGERSELRQQGSSPDRPKVYRYFQHPGWPLLTL